MSGCRLSWLAARPPTFSARTSSTVAANGMMNDYEDLQWLAFCYVAGELDTQQRASFETRLETDQLAREAVARAHELIDCVVSVSDAARAPAVRLAGTAISNGWMQGAMGAALGAAVCLLLVIGVVGVLRDDKGLEEAPFAGAVNTDTEHLATIWNETREPLDQPLWLDRQAEDVVLAEENDLSEEPSSAWIQAAVFGMARDEVGGLGDPESGGTL